MKVMGKRERSVIRALKLQRIRIKRVRILKIDRGLRHFKIYKDGKCFYIPMLAETTTEGCASAKREIRKKAVGFQK